MVDQKLTVKMSLKNADQELAHEIGSDDENAKFPNFRNTEMLLSETPTFFVPKRRGPGS